METVEEQNSPPPLYPSLAPVMLFDCGRGGAEPEEENGSARLVYSIPKKQLFVASGLDGFVDDVNWITPQGWVLTLDTATRNASLIDPFTSRRVHLPPDLDGLLASSDDTTCIMSIHLPTDPGCVVLMVHLTDPVLCYCRPEGSRWFRHEYRPELLVVDDRHRREHIIDAMSRLTAVGGKFYTYWDDKLATHELSPDPTLSTSHVVVRPLPVGCYYSKGCLVESCGELFMVRFCYTPLGNQMILRVELQKLEWSRSAWVTVTSLGTKRVFFLNRYQFGASMPADKVGLKANCVYFSNNDDKGLYVYDIAQGTTALHNPGSEIPDSMEPIYLMPVT